MKQVKIGIIGAGNIGHQHIMLLEAGEQHGMEKAAVYCASVLLVG